MDDSSDVMRAWILAVVFNVVKAIGLAQAVGIVRVYAGSLAATEDHELLRATFGPPPDNPADAPAVRRLSAVHRNELENLPLFFALSYAYAGTSPPIAEARALFGLFTAARLCHNLCYALKLSPWRSIAWGVAVQAMLIMAGRCAAWLQPSKAVGWQVVINAPLLLQWCLGCCMHMTVREQRQRYDEYVRRSGLAPQPEQDEDEGLDVERVALRRG
jgi:uncharacterized MAPEG superfamily protein